MLSMIVENTCLDYDQFQWKCLQEICHVALETLLLKFIFQGKWFL